MRIKICGLTRAEDALAAVAAGADAIGLVFAAGRRRVPLDSARAILAAVPPWFPVVGVFRDAPESEVLAALAELSLTHLQFHGREDLAYLDRFDRPLIRALPLVSDEHEAAARELAAARPGVRLLVDGAEGGSGTACDWSRAARLARDHAVILAGGLTPANVAAAIAAVRPAGVDVSSGVESAPAVKDADRIRRFVAAARGA